MSQIFELFGYPINDRSTEAQENRRRARCPFMERDCDGGGNRPQSAVDVSKNETLKGVFGDRSLVHAGICSLQLTPDSRPWIVCPRRLLSLNRKNKDKNLYQRELDTALLKVLDYQPGTRLGVWSEVGLKYTETGDGAIIDVEVEPVSNVDEEEEGVDSSGKTFDYRFDYIIMPIGRVSLADAANSLGLSEEETRRFLKRQKGYSMVVENCNEYIDDFPYAYPYVIEIMTSSTSGGNKRKRSTIPMAFEDAILGRAHAAPGINYRQVWARMVSQLIVKSEVAIGWGGKTIWIVQDTLIDYISKSTALDIHSFAAKQLSEVNMLSFAYGDHYKNPSGVIGLTDTKLFAGPIAPGGLKISDKNRSFLDILRTPILPSLSRLTSALVQKKFINTLEVF